MNDQLVRRIVAEVLADCAPAPHPIPVEVSARHIHLSRSHLEALFGSGHRLEPMRELSQPGQFLCAERVRLIGPRGVLENVAVLGPVREATQAELSATDARLLGIAAPPRLSGDLSDAANLLVSAGERHIHAPQCAIIAKNHIHMQPADAARLGIAGAAVRVRVDGLRPLTFEDVAVRVSESFRLAMHIDFDEANACLWREGTQARLAAPFAGAPAPQPASARSDAAADGSALPDWDGRLVTARVAEELRALGKGRLLLPGKTIVTPSAMDVLRQARIEVAYLQEEGASP